MKKILITGAAGYIGAQLAFKLMLKGNKVFGVDNFSSGNIDICHLLKDRFSKQFFMYNVDICDYPSLAKIFHLNNIDIVVHCAAKKNVADSLKNSLDYYDNNVLGLINLVKVMKINNVIKIVFCSSSAIYRQQSSNISEDCPIKILSPYADTKFIGERVLTNARMNYKLQVIVLRIFNPVGITNDFSYGLLKKSLFGTVPSNFIDNIRNGVPVNVYGVNYDTLDGSTMRDFVHIEDLLAAIILSIDLMMNDINASYTVNIGSGTGTSILNLAKIIANTLNLHYQVRELPGRKNDVLCSIADIRKAHKILKWSPQYSLEQAIYSMVNKP